MKTQYVYAEPEQVTAFVDQQGRLHASRELAIEHNVQIDLRSIVEWHVAGEATLHEAPFKAVYDMIFSIMRDNPGLARQISETFG